MSLLNQVKGKKEIKPISVLFYGVHGIGKTSFAAGAEKPIFIGVEENNEFDVARFPKVTSWGQLKDQLTTLMKEKHDYRTVVIDTIDGLEEIAQLEILTGKDAQKSMATARGGFGKAYEEMENMFVDIRDNYLAKLRDAGMQVIVLAHSEKNKFEDPMLAISYDTYSTSCHKKCKSIFQDWCQAILFANYDLVRAENASGKEYAESLDGKRVIYTEERPSHIGKNRFDLPYELEFPKQGSWAIFKRLVWEFYKKTGAEISKPVSLVESTPEPTPEVTPEPQKEASEPVQDKKLLSEWKRLKTKADKLLEKVTDDLILDAMKKALAKAEEKNNLTAFEAVIAKIEKSI